MYCPTKMSSRHDQTSITTSTLIRGAAKCAKRSIAKLLWTAKSFPCPPPGFRVAIKSIVGANAYSTYVCIYLVALAFGVGSLVFHSSGWHHAMHAQTFAKLFVPGPGTSDSLVLTPVPADLGVPNTTCGCIFYSCLHCATLNFSASTCGRRSALRPAFNPRAPFHNR
jgi:hypothetical protein